MNYISNTKGAKSVYIPVSTTSSSYILQLRNVREVVDVAATKDEEFSVYTK